GVRVTRAASGMGVMVGGVCWGKGGGGPPKTPPPASHSRLIVIVKPRLASLTQACRRRLVRSSRNSCEILAAAGQAVPTPLTERQPKRQIGRAGHQLGSGFGLSGFD